MTGYDPQRTRRRPTTTRGNAAAVEALLGGVGAEPAAPVRAAGSNPAAASVEATSMPIRPASPVQPELDLSSRGGCLSALIGLRRR